MQTKISTACGIILCCFIFTVLFAIKEKTIETIILSCILGLALLILGIWDLYLEKKENK